MPVLTKKARVISCVPISKESLPKIRVSKLMPDGHGKCVRCSREATHVITYTLESEDHRVVYSNIFSDSRMMTADHILPRALGGANKLSNLQLMCCICNRKKGMLPSSEEIERIVQNRSNHIRPSFELRHMRYVIKQFPSLAPLYDLSGQEEGPADPFKRTVFNKPRRISKKIRKVILLSEGLVNNKHPHHPMWGWVRIFERYPELKSQVSFA